MKIIQKVFVLMAIYILSPVATSFLMHYDMTYRTQHATEGTAWACGIFGGGFSDFLHCPRREIITILYLTKLIGTPLYVIPDKYNFIIYGIISVIAILIYIFAVVPIAMKAVVFTAAFGLIGSMFLYNFMAIRENTF